MIEDLEVVFDKFDDDSGKFEDMPAELKLYPRPDMCAFHILHCLLPDTENIINWAEYDKVWLNIDCEQLAAVAREEHIQNLTRCGVMYDVENDSLSMFA